MQVIVIESCNECEFARVCDHQASAAQAHHTADPQLSYDAIDVHWRQTERVSEHNLRQRHLKSIAVRQSNIESSYIELAHQVCDAPGTVAPTHAHNPGSQGVFIDQLRPPERSSDCRTRLDEFFYSLSIYQGDARRRQRRNRMLHPIQYRGMEVTAIAGHQEGGDLTRTFGKQLIAASPAT